MTSIAYNLEQVHKMIARSCGKCSRNPEDITLLCVSKTKPIEMIKEAYQSGERHFGESYAQEAQDKIAKLKAKGYNDIVWHFIGPIQSNKTRIIAENFDIVESVDRAKILDRLNEQRPNKKGVLNVLIQVNISDEEQKQGCTLSEVSSLLEHASSLPKLKVVGLMAIGKADAEDIDLILSFAKLEDLFKQLQVTYPSLRILSLGMTHDAEIAICNGSTEVRIGSAIFGEREYINYTGQVSPHKS